jgi:hypothetical protein
MLARQTTVIRVCLPGPFNFEAAGQKRTSPNKKLIEQLEFQPYWNSRALKEIGYKLSVISLPGQVRVGYFLSTGLGLDFPEPRR